jgi:HPt (histidine-containing phosphotransfer) domain-containing protein
MAGEAPGKEFEVQFLQMIVKQGGKKKLDVLLELFRKEAPIRLEEMAQAQDAQDAKASARVLKSSCANLGLMGLESLCEQIMEGRSHKELLPQLQASLKKSLKWLEEERRFI